MKKLSLVALWAVSLVLALLVGYGSRRAFAQESAGGQSASSEKYPSDVFPDTRSRSPKATRDELLNDEDKAAFDNAISKGEVAYSGWNGIRLHIPAVHTDYRNAIQTLDKEVGESRYQHLAMIIGARFADDESDWNNHVKLSEKTLPREAVAVLKDGKDTKGLDEKDAILIQFGRELFQNKKVSSKTFADTERLFGRRKTYALVQTMIFFNGSGYLLHAYDYHLAPGEPHPFSNQ